MPRQGIVVSHRPAVAPLPVLVMIGAVAFPFPYFWLVLPYSLLCIHAELSSPKPVKVAPLMLRPLPTLFGIPRSHASNKPSNAPHSLQIPWKSHYPSSLTVFDITSRCCNISLATYRAISIYLPPPLWRSLPPTAV